jgi:threonine/homoserine efflux transporter RhtA
VIQNAGITRTSVSHAALLVGAAPVLVAVVAALWHHTVARPVAWAGFAISLAGVGLVTGGSGGGATAAGDGLVLASLLLSATFTVAQTRVLRGRDPIAVTAVQFLGAALAVLPFSVATEGMPTAPGGAGAVLAAGSLVAGGTLLPFTLFAYAQSRVSAEVAGAFLNLEPLVGAVAGVAIFGDPAGLRQLAGGAAIVAGIALSSLPLLATGRLRAGRPALEGRDQPQQAGRGQRQPARRGPRHAAVQVPAAVVAVPAVVPVPAGAWCALARLSRALAGAHHDGAGRRRLGQRCPLARRRSGGFAGPGRWSGAVGARRDRAGTPARGSWTHPVPAAAATDGARAASGLTASRQRPAG